MSAIIDKKTNVPAMMTVLGLDERTARRLSKAATTAIESKQQDHGKRKLSQKTLSAIGAVAKICEINKIVMSFEGPYPIFKKNNESFHCTE